MAAVSYFPNFFSIDDILITHERTPCKFLVDVPSMGNLNPSVEEKDLKAGTALELPYWLVESLSSGRHPLVAAELPKVYREAYREILKADPTAVELQKFGLHFYEFGMYVRKFDNTGDVTNILEKTFKLRFMHLMDLADTVCGDPSVYNRLDTLERRLLRDSQIGRSKLNEWLIESSTPLVAAATVMNHKKRKRVEIEDVL